MFEVIVNSDQFREESLISREFKSDISFNELKCLGFYKITARKGFKPPLDFDVVPIVPDVRGLGYSIKPIIRMLRSIPRIMRNELIPFIETELKEYNDYHTPYVLLDQRVSDFYLANRNWKGVEAFIDYVKRRSTPGILTNNPDVYAEDLKEIGLDVLIAGPVNRYSRPSDLSGFMSNLCSSNHIPLKEELEFLKPSRGIIIEIPNLEIGKGIAEIIGEVF